MSNLERKNLGNYNSGKEKWKEDIYEKGDSGTLQL